MNNVLASRIILALIVVGYIVVGLWNARANQEQVDIKVDEITPAAEIKTINPQILQQKAVTDIEAYRLFGNRPVQAAPGNLDRPNPFAGI